MARQTLGNSLVPRAVPWVPHGKKVVRFLALVHRRDSSLAVLRRERVFAWLHDNQDKSDMVSDSMDDAALSWN